MTKMTKAEFIAQLEELKQHWIDRLADYEPGSGLHLSLLGRIDAYSMAIYYAQRLED